jgi:hypothetical protein
MSAHVFEKKIGGRIELDLCFACQGIWFDEYESAQLAPGGVIDLFRLIQAHRDDQRLPLADPVFCPRCDEPLKHGMDRVRSGMFNYHRCLQQHGRFTTFAQFMTEKGFVRHLTGVEVAALQEGLGVVRCNSCGAPVDIRREPVCGHCRSPLVVLDPQAVEQALAGYHQAELKRTHADPEAMADAIIASERARKAGRTGAQARGVEHLINRDLGDLLVDGVGALLSSLRR